MDNAKRLVNYHIARLHSKDADVRLGAVHELALLGDAETLPVLQQVFEHDRDARVRAAAQAAGRQIFQRLRQTR
jgi:HEAT repeat protein